MHLYLKPDVCQEFLLCCARHFLMKICAIKSGESRMEKSGKIREIFIAGCWEPCVNFINHMKIQQRTSSNFHFWSTIVNKLYRYSCAGTRYVFFHGCPVVTWGDIAASLTHWILTLLLKSKWKYLWHSYC